jgi:RNA chaperone Hfq
MSERSTLSLHANRDPRSLGNASPAPRSTEGTSGARKEPKFTPKGHDRTLNDAQHAGTVVTLRLVSGDDYVGTVTRRDKFTITLCHVGGQDDGCLEVVYKHAICGVLLPKVSP